MTKNNNSPDNQKSLLEEVFYVFKTYFKGRLKIAFILGILAFLFLRILNIPYTAAFSVMIGILNLIPFLGPLISGFIITLFTLIVEGLSKTLWVLGTIIVLQIIESLILEPKILGKSFGLSPIFIFIVVFLGGNIFGILGMVLAVPIAVILRKILKTYI